MNRFTRFSKRFPLAHALRFGGLIAARRALNPDAILTYSQTGEDMIIQKILESVTNGFYVEIGSNEPVQHSNTFGLYLKGWRGITVDANAAMVAMHRKVRPNDTAVCAAVSDEEKEVTFYEFDMDEISTIDADFYAMNKDQQRVNRQTTLTTRTLNSIMVENLPSETSIDLLSIDVEGHDFNVLKSIDLKMYRPKLIVIEMHDFALTNPTANDVYNFLVEHNYRLAGYAIWNGYFVANEFSVKWLS